MSLAQYKLFKKTSDDDKDRGNANANKAGLATAVAALLAGKGKAVGAGTGPLARAASSIRSTKMRRGIAGYVAGTAAVHGVRAVTTGTKDAYGDRSRNAKTAEKLPMYAGLAGAAYLVHRRVFSARGKVITFGAADAAAKAGGLVGVGGVIGAARRLVTNRRTLKTAGEVGAIAAGDLIAEKVHDDWQEKKKQQQGTTMSAVMRCVVELSREQLRDENWRHVNPLKAASGEIQARKGRVDHNGQWVRDTAGKIYTDPVDVPVAHAQVLRAAYNKGMTIQRYGRRGVNLTKDAVGAIQGKKKVDERGRPMKREWEKTWFKSAVGAAAVGAGLLAHAQIMRKNSGYRAKVIGAKNAIKSGVSRVIPGAFADFSFSPVGLIMLDAYAEMKGWDVRDPRGRSARVFAPGSRRRERREKTWSEKVSNIRKLAIAGTLIGGAAGVGGGILIGRRMTRVAAPLKPVAGEAHAAAAAAAHTAPEAATGTLGKLINFPDFFRKKTPPTPTT